MADTRGDAASSMPALEGSVPVDQAGIANNSTRRDTTQDAVAEKYKDANPTTQAKNTLVSAPKSGAGNVLTGEKGNEGVPPGQTPAEPEEGERTVATLGAADRVGPGTGDGLDTRPLGDPDAPQGTGPEVPGGNIYPPPAERPAPAGEIRTSWAEQGHTNS